MRTFFRILDRFELYCGAFFVSVMVTLLLIQVIFRYVFNAALSWSEELSRFTFMFSIYFAAAWAAKRDGHIRVTALVDLFPPRIRAKILFVSDMLWVAFNLVVIKYGIEMIGSMIAFPQHSPVLGLPLWIAYSIIPFGFALMTFRILQRYFLKMTGRQTEESKEVF